MTTRTLFVTLSAFAALTIACSSDAPPRQPLDSNPPQQAAVQPAGDPHHGHSHDDFGRVSIEALQKGLADGTMIAVDVRSEQAFQSGHITGALSIPPNRLAATASLLPADKTIITYCSCPAEESSGGAVLMLREVGIHNAAALVGGYEKWKAAGLPVSASN